MVPALELTVAVVTVETPKPEPAPLAVAWIRPVLAMVAELPDLTPVAFQDDVFDARI